jgi:hypothetical protein
MREQQRQKNPVPGRVGTAGQKARVIGEQAGAVGACAATACRP